MEVLFIFFKWVASFSHVDEETGSKMDLHNLATVITPNILYSKKDPTKDKDDSLLAIEVVHSLLRYQDDFWMVKISNPLWGTLFVCVFLLIYLFIYLFIIDLPGTRRCVVDIK